jgi:hypothetical protein
MVRISTREIADAAVTGAKLAPGSITADKLARGVLAQAAASLTATWGGIGGNIADQKDLNERLAGNLSATAAYADPSWLTSLSASKLTGIVPAANLGNGSPLSGTYTFDATTPGSVTSMTFVDGILTGVTTL